MIDFNEEINDRNNTNALNVNKFNSKQFKTSNSVKFVQRTVENIDKNELDPKVWIKNRFQTLETLRS